MPKNPSLPESLHGKHVLLKRVSLADAKALHEVFSNSEAVKYLNLPAAKSVEDTLGWIGRSRNTATAFHAAWSVFEKNTGDIAGVINYYDREPWQDRLRISYAFLPKYFKERWLNDSLDAIVGVCFKNLKSHRVEAWVNPDDAVSKAVLAKMFFKAEGILRDRFRLGDRYRNVISYSLLTSEWKQSSRQNKFKRDDSKLFWRLPQNPVDKLPNDENKFSGPCIGLAIPVCLIGNRLKGFNADREVTINAPHKVLKAIIETADGLHTAEEIAASVPASFDKIQVKALLQGMEDQGVLIPSERRIENQWPWLQNPPIFFRNVPEDLPFKLARDASLKASKRARGNIVFKATNSGLPFGFDKRKTTREFDGKPLTDFEITQILYAAYGVLDQRAENHYGSHMRRVVPSAGGIYPLVLTWVQWRKTNKLDAGVYRVNFGAHKTLGFNKISDDCEQVFRAMLDPLPVAKAHGILIVSANFAPSRSKYGNRAVPYALIEAGHVAQNLQMICAALGKGVWEIGGFIEREAKALTQLTCEPLLTVAMGNFSRKRRKPAVALANVEFAWIDKNGTYKPPFHLARAQIKIGGTHTDWCWGRSANPLLAAQKSVGEAVERYACQTPKGIWWARPKDISRYINPEKFVSYPSQAYKRKGFPFSPFSANKKYPWVTATNIQNGKSVPVLADHVFFNDSLGKKYTHPYTSVSTSGVAAYYTEEGAIERAVRELIERHMFMLCWLGRTAPQHVAFVSLPYNVQARIMELNSYGWDITVLSMGDSPVISLLIFAQHTKACITRVAAASGFDAESTLYHVLEEIESSIPVDTVQRQAVSRLTPEKVSSTRDHGNLYYQKKYFKKADWLLGNALDVSFKSLKSKTRSTSEIFAFFQEKGISTYLVNMTPRLNVSSHLTANLEVVRILVERTLPIAFGYGLQPRLTPLIFGVDPDKKLTENSFPHPFD